MIDGQALKLLGNMKVLDLGKSYAQKPQKVVAYGCVMYLAKARYMFFKHVFRLFVKKMLCTTIFDQLNS
jgi:hypothetical protein